MPWSETRVMDERMGFVTAYLSGEESVASLCRHFGISRKTGHKWINRYRELGPGGLHDRSRAPLHRSGSIEASILEEALSVRHRHPSWGPRKVKAWLEDRYPDRSWPAASTLGAAFDRAGLTRARKRRRRSSHNGRALLACREANDVWCIDFKGWFLTGDATHVEPLTLSDAHSRFLLRLQAVGRADEEHVWPILEGAFQEFGLPSVLRSDNGPPFASSAVAGLSRFAVKVIKAGVYPERIEPGKPQQNGRLERLHLTLKQDTADPPAHSLAEQMQRFHHFQDVYNRERPHEALDQTPPARHYHVSPRQFDGVLRSPEYTEEARVRRVRHCGAIKWQGEEVFISQALTGEPVGLFPIADDVWLVKYGHIVLGTMKGREGFIRVGPGRPSRTNAKPKGGQTPLPMSSG